MNDNLKYLRNENKQQGDVEEAEQNIQKMALDNESEDEQAENLKPEDQKPQE